MSELSDSIKTNAQGLKKVKGDMGESEQHSLTDQIAADAYLSGQTAVTKKGFGLRVQKIVPPGAI